MGTHGSKEAIAVRDKFKDYFNHEGAVEWQRKARFLE